MSTSVGKPKRVLIISDSLGTSIHARGIFHFTCSVVQTMSKLGCEVSLLVEPPNSGVVSEMTPLTDGTVMTRGRQYAAMCDIIRHFETDRFRFDWQYHDASLQRLSTQYPDVADFRLALLDSWTAQHLAVLEIDPLILRECRFGKHSEHLKLFKSLVLAKGAYSDSFRRAYLGLRPFSVDASGFDLVYIDTPHYVSVHGIEPEKVCCVVHDFIPFFDVDMGFDWRQLFARKIECSIRTAGHLVFNSETTKRYFQRIYGDDWHGRQTIIYPANRVEVEAAAAQGRRSKSQYLHDIVDNKRAEQRAWAQHSAQGTGAAQQKSSKWIPTKTEAWRPDLPFFCSILSDEPRKNIQAIVTASTKFQGRANFIIMGQINGNRYMNDRPGDFPNLHFTGYVSDWQKFDLLSSATGFIFPSLAEGFGIPIIEAAMFGTPVICTDSEVFREVTFDKASYFAPGNDEGLWRHIEALCGGRDAATRGAELQRLAENAFSQSAITDRVRSLFSA